MLDNIIKTVENPVYQNKEDIYKHYKGYHFMVTNIKMTSHGEPYTWLGGIVRFYSKNYKELSRFMAENDILEYERSSLMYSPADDSIFAGGILV